MFLFSAIVKSNKNYFIKNWKNQMKKLVITLIIVFQFSLAFGAEGCGCPWCGAQELERQHPTQGAFTPLEISPGKYQIVNSAYPYKHLSEAEKARAYTVLERTYVILDAAAGQGGVDTGKPGSTNIAIIPNLKPCIGIIIHYGARVAVFHQHFSSNIEDLVAKTNTHLGMNEQTNPEEIKIYMYTIMDEDFKKARYQGRTQEKEFAQVKRNLTQHFRIRDKRQIKDCLWIPKIENYVGCGDYYGLERSVVVSISERNELAIYNTSLVHERIFFERIFFEQVLFEQPDKYPELMSMITASEQSSAFSTYQTELLGSSKYRAFYDLIGQYGTMPYMRALHIEQYFHLGRLSVLNAALESREQTLSRFERFKTQPIPCYVCGKTQKENSRCAQCKEYHYCSQDCQKKHWKGGHKKECQILTAHAASQSSDHKSERKGK